MSSISNTCNIYSIFTFNVSKMCNIYIYNIDVDDASHK